MRHINLRIERETGTDKNVNTIANILVLKILYLCRYSALSLLMPYSGSMEMRYVIIHY